MESSFLTIAEASEKTGKSLSTIRRVIKSIADNPKHPDRAAIEPSPKEVDAFKKKDENFAWKIREDVLVRETKTALKEGKKSQAAAQEDIVSILERELGIKNEQIAKQWEVIHSLNDRLREGNILMGSLQKRLALPEPKAEESPVVEAAVTASSAEPVTKASKRRFFGWFR